MEKHLLLCRNNSPKIELPEKDAIYVRRSKIPTFRSPYIYKHPIFVGSPASTLLHYGRL